MSIITFISVTNERRVDRRSLSPPKISQFALCLYNKLGSILSLDMRLDGNALSFLDLSAKNFQRKKFSCEEIFVGRNFATWFLIAKITKISASRKFPAIQFFTSHLICPLLLIL